MQLIQNSQPKDMIFWIRAAAFTCTVAGLALLAPALWLAVSGGVGLFLLGALWTVAFAAAQALPLLGQKLENALLAARKAEARRNPIEQLQNEVLRRAQRLKAFRQALVTVGGQIESIGEMLEEHKRTDPNQPAERQERALARLQQFHTLNLARLGQAQAALHEFKTSVERKEREWRIALAIGEANDMLDPNATENLMQDLLTDTALRAVQDRFNNVFAELDVQMSSMAGPTRLLLDERSLDPLDALHLPQQAFVGRQA